MVRFDPRMRGGQLRHRADLSVALASGTPVAGPSAEITMSLTTRIESHFPASFFGGAASDRLRTFSARQRLSRREADVLGAALHGLSMKEAATVLSLSPKTVENYWSRIYAKTGQTSQLAVVARLWMSDVMPIQDI